MLPRILRLLLLSYGLLGWMPAHADAIAKLEHFFQQTHSLKGQFEQRVYETKGPLLRTTSGTFELARPNQFNWAYLKPREQLIVSNGKKMWIYDKDLAQVTVTPVAKQLGQAPIMLLGGGTPLSESFKLSDDGSRDNLSWVELIPKQQHNAQFNRILLGLSGGLVRQMILYDQFGHRTVINLSALQLDPSLPSSDFNFTAPPGVDVVDGM